MAKKDFEELLEAQRKLQSMVAREQEMDRTIDILAIINEMAPYPDQRLQKEAVLIEAQNRGFLSDETQKIIERLLRERILFEPVPGFIQRR